MTHYTQNISIMGSPLPPSKEESEWTLSNPDYTVDGDIDLIKLEVHLAKLATMGL